MNEIYVKSTSTASFKSVWSEIERENENRNLEKKTLLLFSA